MSLRVKLLIVFSMVFSIVFAGAFYWFYTFTTDQTISRLRKDLRSTLLGAAAGLDVDELISLYEEGIPNDEGFSDDPRYLNQMEWFETVKRIEPRAWLYSYVVGDPEDNRRVGDPAVQPGRPETIYLVDLWARYDPTKAVQFLEPDFTSSRSLQVLEKGELIEEPRIYEDEWGTWMSAFTPLQDETGEIVAILGLDIEADYIFQLQSTIRNRVLVSFIITYGILFSLIYVLSGMLTRHLSELTQSAQQIAAGNYSLDGPLGRSDWSSRRSQSGSSHLRTLSEKLTACLPNLPDEMDTLSQVFEGMVESIRTREQMIREGKQIEDEIRQALQIERELNELQSRFVSIVSHEFRTPLTVLRTSVELLEKYSHRIDETKRHEYFQRIRGAIANMTQLLEDVLVVGKAEAGKMDCKPTLLDLNRYCCEIVDEMQISNAGRTISFSSVGNCSTACVDPNLLRPILTNLLSNAIKYSAADTRVELKLSCSEDAITFEVRDQGIGIPCEDQTNLFQLFHRATNAESIRGTGLGLAIVKQCVTYHQGKIKFESQLGMGTTFVVSLPRLAPTDPILSSM